MINTILTGYLIALNVTALLTVINTRRAIRLDVGLSLSEIIRVIGWRRFIIDNLIENLLLLPWPLAINIQLLCMDDKVFVQRKPRIASSVWTSNANLKPANFPFL